MLNICEPRLIRQIERPPTGGYPTVMGLSAAAAALAPAFIWRRIEGWIAWRWTERTVVWNVQGPGRWDFPLTPVKSITSTTTWDATNPPNFNTAVELEPTPFGLRLFDDGYFNIVAVVGDSTAVVPDDLKEAFRRLAEYLAQKSGRPGASVESVKAGSVEVSVRRDPDFVAKALFSSGCADLLRPYRTP